MNCWSYAVKQFSDRGGWLMVRFTRRSKAKPRRWLKCIGTGFIALGIFLTNWGFMLRAGRWLHVYHADSVHGPYTSYEPDTEVDLGRPPLRFKGKVQRRDNLK